MWLSFLEVFDSDALERRRWFAKATNFSVP